MTNDPQVARVTRNRDRTRAQILAAARDEFSLRGYEGARVEAIAERAGSNKRMLYYYFKNKDELFLAVMEETYRGIRDAEAELRLLDLPPIDAIRALVTFTWEYYLAHPEFLSLLNSENLYHAQHLRRSTDIRSLNSPLIDTLGEILARGHREKLFRGGVDPLQLYISIAALGYFYLSNNATLCTVFGRDLSTPKARLERLQHMIDMVLGYLLIN
ncbi:TetR/AcrR family transcriptional regulator [Pandoraea apista]|uniref:TetR family transcriptional regulator n=1 Tax=Pandoraea apista TaxID=93218 RepID=A0A0B5F1T5_9BURK|nr:TetR/AcrR family transcriptional regulator [Pandoraea apista]AJE97315.1 TetR family transcriptional regulator [Pandoraea apista]AKH71285.1 TetR family transcriptional regulator [Pandoraea apista]AKI63557.1 TetR family transcriptional regulator [Pandoraea apista]ALS67350.1 TetR family transcriptional regulator [Pandoraea apista]AVF41929.1 TetR/AcrR family transcriptional regulator [Pandoraea apista]